MSLESIGIFGAGSIGCYLGGRLQAAGFAVRFVGRPRIGQELREHGLRLSDLHGYSARLQPEAISFFENAEGLRGCSVVLVCTKSGGTAEAGAALAPVVDKHTLVVSMQNGVRNQATLAAALAESGATALAGMVPFNVLHSGQGRFHCGTSGQLLVAQNQANSAAPLIAALRRSGLEAAEHPNLPGVLWGKLLVNLNNAVNALAGIPLREQLGDRRFRRIVAALIDEGLAVLRQAGIAIESAGKMRPKLAPIVLRLPDFLFFRVAASMVRIDPQARSSMWEDLSLGRKTEIDAINSEIVALAREIGGSAPINARICDLIHQAEAAGKGSPQMDAATLGAALGV